ncbi:MAG: hypothetical protein LBG15_12170 [Dysgonamonadaceae bacterium]|jgi:hypothetical protein|nr:hypothetical protein [Dysgonamonadaceae bacterium]
MYKSFWYWSLDDYLSVISAMRGIDYVYFTSGKSQVEELFLFLQDEFQSVTPFSMHKERVSIPERAALSITTHE